MTMILCGRLRTEPSPQLVSGLEAAGTGTLKMVERDTGPQKGTSYPQIRAREGHAFLWQDQIQCNIGDGGQLFGEIYPLIREHENDLRHYNLRVDDNAQAYPEDRGHIIGYVLHTRDVNSLLNPPEDYLEPPIRSCQLRLRPGVAPILSEQPKGLLLTAPDDGYVIHSELLRLLDGNGATGQESVVHKNKTLKDWRRVHIRRRKAVLDDIAFMPTDCSLSCASCGREMISALNDLWFSRSNDLVQGLEVDRRGEDHYGETPILLLSPEKVQALRHAKMVRRANVWLSRIYTKDTRRYEVISMIRELMAKHGDPVAKHSSGKISRVDPADVVKALQQFEQFVKDTLAGKKK